MTGTNGRSNASSTSSHTSSDSSPDSNLSFTSFNLDERLLSAIRGMGFESPTPIQGAAIPPGLEGKDVLATAMTGSGKTAAFLLPILQRLLSTPGQGTRALIVTPTRELAAQIVEHFDDLSKGTGLKAIAIFGGVGAKPQEKALRRGVDVVVATPGRLLDHFQYDYARLPGIEVVVLDEADRMLDMGFLPEIRKILRHLPKGPRQTLLFSATMPGPIAKLASEMLRNPVRVEAQTKQAPPSAITQALYPVPAELKVDLLAELLRREEVGNVIVFCRTKHRAKRLSKKLGQRGIAAAEIHGNRSQKQRTEALAGFRDGRYDVLAATDILARGIDVVELDHVVNFDVPGAPEDYIHRIGRTARAGASGEAYTFVAPDEEGGVRDIERALGRSLPRRTLADFDYSAKADERFEVPVSERLAKHRARRKDERERAKKNEERRGRSSGGRGR
ncbi:MAG: DEAD/DEAH box helicase [Gemmatimonadales bacterium]|nr:MAG: DEAD/DEAH box helicase [Gemmatimonadales bacterium]